MRRISVKYARPGMVLGAPVYTSYGSMLLSDHVRLNEACVKDLRAHGVREILLDDWRLADVPVQTLFSPEVEGRVAMGLRQLMVESRRIGKISDRNFEQAVTAMSAMTQELALETVGEATVAGIVSQEDYTYVQPVKVAGLSLLMAKRLGYSMPDLPNLGLAALLKDIGYVSISPELLGKPGLPREQGAEIIRAHPVKGYELLSQHYACDREVAKIVFQHHERWNGSGYPQGAKGSGISHFAQIIAITDTYCTMLSERPERKAFMPHQAMEYIMAYSGEQFNPKLVQLFVKHVPLYPSGLTVKLNTGEVGIVCNVNLGFVGRPVVRILYHDNMKAVEKPYDMDLSKADYLHKAVAQVLGYD